MGDPLQKLPIAHQQEDLRDFLENAVVPLHWVDAQGIIIWANRAEMGLLGYQPAEYIGHHIAEFHADKEVVGEILERLGRYEELRGRDARLRCKDGSIRVVRIHSNVFAPGGTFVHTRCFTIDVTEEWKSQEAKARLAAIVAGSDDAIISKDLNSIITSWNAAATRIFGYQPHEIIGRSVLTLIPPELQYEEPIILARLTQGLRIDHYETKRVRKDGTLIDVSLTISPVKDPSGQIIGASKIARDISERRRSQEALRVADRLAMVGRLAATIAHEINNPLEAVVNLVYLAKTALPKDLSAAKEFLALAEQELARVTHITRQTLAFYRGGQKAERTRVADHLHHLASVFAPKMNNKSIRLVVDIRHDLAVHAAGSDLQQVFTNLFSNSIDAVGEEGMIRVRVSRATLSPGNVPAVRVSIADSGAGIPPAVASRIFEAFFTTKKDVGTGLGLWVSQGIVNGMGGKIRMRTSTVRGRSGTVFSVLLPTSPSESRAVAC